VDGSGNVYVADNGNAAVKEMPSGCTSSSCVTTVSNNFGGPQGVAVDGSGNVYVADSNNSAIDEMPLSTPPALSFASTIVGSTSSDSPQTVTVANIGNMPLSFPALSASINPSIATNFGYTASCPAPTKLPVSSGGTAQTLGAGAQCTLSISFVPTTPVALLGNLTLTDNNLNANPSTTTQTIDLSGTGLLPITLSPAILPAAIYGTPYNQSVTASGGSGSLYTYSATGLPAGLSIKPATGTITGTPTAAGDYAISVTVTDGSGNMGTGSVSLIVNPATLSVVVNSVTLTYGGTYPVLGGTVTGLVNGDTTASVGLVYTTTPTTTSTSTPGAYPITATITSPNYTLSVTPGMLTITAETSTLSFTPIPSKIYGSAPFTVSATSASSGLITYAVLRGPATISGNGVTITGVGTIMLQASQVAAGNYAAETVNTSFTVGQAATSTMLSASAGSITTGQSVTLTATVTDASMGSTGTPTGTVTFFDGTTPLGTGTLTNGVASYSTSTLSAGVTHSLTASYGGDVNFVASTSSAPTTVSVGALGFSFTLSGGASQTVVPGSAASYNFQVSPTSGTYAGTVSFTVTGLPAGATAVFSPSTIAVDGGAQPMTMTVQTAAATASNNTLFKSTAVALSFLLVPLFGLSRRKRLARLLCISLLVLSGGAAASLLSGCGATNGFFSQGQQSYLITVTATSGSATQISVVTLIVE
jgi:hypothetical protein